MTVQRVSTLFVFVYHYHLLYFTSYVHNVIMIAYQGGQVFAIRCSDIPEDVTPALATFENLGIVPLERMNTDTFVGTVPGDYVILFYLLKSITSLEGRRPNQWSAGLRIEPTGFEPWPGYCVVVILKTSYTLWLL